MKSTRMFCLLTSVAWIVVTPALAQSVEKIKVATTFLGLWDTSQPKFCQDRGEFRKAGLDVDVLSTRGGSENVQAVTSGAVDIGYSPGTNAVMAAQLQGAKIKIISAEFLGQNDTFFYVRADSPLKTIDDIAGKTVAFPRPGGAGEAILLALKAERRIDFKAIATGAMDATFTMAMTKQVDVGHSVPPTLLDDVEKKTIRVLFAGDDVKSLSNVTGRVIIASDSFLKSRPGVAAKFLQVLDGCIDWAYANPAESSKMFAELNKVDARIAEKAIGFYKRSTLAFGPIVGLSDVINQAIAGKFVEKAPSDAQLKDMIDIVYTSKP